jgi:eukaryotic-like serine/threonine-protein kinase
VILELPVTLADRYNVSELLGSGSFAETYLAEDRQEDTAVAVKVLRPHYASDPETLTRFEREAQATSEIEHPNVVRTLDYNISADPPYLIMEYVAGPDLKEILQEHGAFSPEDAVTTIVQILAGLDAIHQLGMIHRDVKPHNVLIDPENGARLCDFSIARALDQTGLTRTGIALGTASYMAPEQAKGREVTSLADLYAVGVMMFEMLTGRVPFQGNDPLEVLYQQVHQDPPSLRDINPEIPGWLEQITLRAMSKEPGERYASANEMIGALSSGNRSEDATRQMDPALIAAQAATAAMPARPVRRTQAVPPPVPPRPAGRSRWLQTPVIVLAALLVVALAVGALYAIGGGDDVPEDEPSTIIDDPDDDTVDEPQVTDDVEPEEPVEQQDPPTEPEPAPDTEEPQPEPEVEAPPAEEEPVEEDEVEVPSETDPEPADDTNENGDVTNQGNPPDHAGGARGEERSDGQGGGNEGQGQGNN